MRDGKGQWRLLGGRRGEGGRGRGMIEIGHFLGPEVVWLSGDVDDDVCIIKLREPRGC